MYCFSMSHTKDKMTGSRDSCVGKHLTCGTALTWAAVSQSCCSFTFSIDFFFCPGFQKNTEVPLYWFSASPIKQLKRRKPFLEWFPFRPAVVKIPTMHACITADNYIVNFIKNLLLLFSFPLFSQFEREWEAHRFYGSINHSRNLYGWRMD